MYLQKQITKKKKNEIITLGNRKPNRLRLYDNIMHLARG